jgi:hypothetical protein
MIGKITIASNDVYRFNQIGRIPAGKKSNLCNVFSLIKMP